MKDKSREIGIVAVVVLVIGLVMALMFSSMRGPSDDAPTEVWYEEMTMGNLEAKNHFVIYSDIACPYCLAFEDAMVEHKDELEQYIAEKDILIEVRATDFLYEYGESASIESRYSAVATYCAKDEGKFWDFYDLAVTRVWNDYFKKQGKTAFSEFNKNGKDYWIQMGREAGLSSDFETCVNEDRTLETVEADAKKMAKYVGGLPYFKFNKFISSGFSLDWGWDYVLEYFDAGLKSR